jgi:uncharacterized membrane protein
MGLEAEWAKTVRILWAWRHQQERWWERGVEAKQQSTQRLRWTLWTMEVMRRVVQGVCGYGYDFVQQGQEMRAGTGRVMAETEDEQENMMLHT